MNYERSQTGPLARVMFAFSVFIVIVTLTVGDAEPGAPLATGLAMLAIVAVVYAFSRLTVKVDTTRVAASFTWGWPHREFLLSDITNIRQVRNKWWYGLGIRLAPNGAWIFSVWGLDAVELELQSGKKFRIGSDDSDGLFAALALTITPQP